MSQIAVNMRTQESVVQQLVQAPLNRVLALLFLLMVSFFLLPSNQAQAAITYQGSSSNPSDGGSLGSSTVAVTPAGGTQTGDLIILVANSRDTSNTIAISNTGGQTWTAETANSITNTTRRIFWARYNGTWSANPSVSFSANTATTVSMHVFRPTISSNTWAIDVTQNLATFTNTSTDVSIASITTLTNGALVFANWASTDNNSWSIQTGGWSTAGSGQYANTNGADSSQSSAYKIMPTAGPSNAVVNRMSAAGTDAGVTAILAFKEVAAVPITASCNSGAISGVINTYYPITQNLSVGATSIVVGTSTGSATQLATNDLVLIMQMQDATINTANTASYGAASAIKAGQYEYATVSSVSGATVTLSSGLLNSYSYQAGTASVAQKTIQLIRVPVYSTATLSTGITASAWNGSTGGIVTFDVTGALTLASQTIDVSGKGFRGGAGQTLGGGSGTSADYRTTAANAANGSKGEGIAGTPRYVNNAGALLDTTIDGYPSGSYAKGAPANAGGGGTDDNPAANDENTGGGGGANAGAGGMGGYGWNAPASPGRGIGGASVSASASQLILGGGGGAASTNNGTGTPSNGFASSGAAGGGIVMIRAGSLSGTGTINVNGANANNTVTNDGSGGGGAAGSAMVLAASGLSGLTVSATGGTGGTNTGGGSAHGPGGGGGAAGSAMVLAASGLSGLTVSATGGTGGTNTGGGSAHGPGGGGGGGYAISSAALAACTVSGGASGTTSGATAYGATAGSAGSCTSTLTAVAIKGATLGQGPCASALDHYELSLPSTSIACLTTNLTVTACADSSSPCTNAYTSANGTTASLTTSAGSLAANTVTFNASGVASTTLTHTAATNGAVVSVTLSGEQTTATNPRKCCPDGVSCVAANSCSSTFNTAGFIFSSAANGASATIPSQVAGTSSGTYYLRAVKTSTTTKACETAIVGSTTVNFAYECNNPSTCSASNLMSLNGGSATTITRNDSGSVSSYTSVPMTFDSNGNAPLTLNYSDVGQVTLYASKAASGSLLTALTGTSNAFVVAPASFAFSALTAAPIKAGNSFSATVTARTSSGATTPNFGRESSPESVTLTASKYQPTGAGAVSGSFSGSLGSFSAGVASGTNLTYSEVGTIDLTATLTSASYLGSGLSATGTTGVTGAVGRFIPDHFDEVVTQGCSTGSYTYSAQPLTVQITARNLSGATTVNYDGTASTTPNFSKAVTLSELNAIAGSLSPTSVAASAFTAGVASASPGFTFTTAPTTASTIKLRAVDTDSVSTATGATESAATALIRSGRLHLLNAYGSELLAIKVPVQAEYYNGTNWIINTNDTCTTIAAGGMTASNGIATNTCFLTNPRPSAPTNASCQANSPAITTAAGVGSWYVFDKTTPQVGYTDLTINLSATPWLLGRWSGSGTSYTENPIARIKFGSPKAPYIYLRERY